MEKTQYGTKKNIFRILCAFVLAVSFVLSGCGNPSLRGKEIVIGTFWEGYDVNDFKPRNEAEEKILEWRTYIQKEYGFTMSEKFIASWEDMPSRAATSIMIDSPAASVFGLQGDWVISMITQNLVYPISDSKVIDLRNPVPVEEGQLPVEWNQSVLDTYTFNGKTYAFSQGINMTNAQVVFFNKRLFKEAGLDPELPYDMQKDGTWTWDKFLELCKKLTYDKDNDGKMDTYAFPRDVSTEILDAIIASNGANYVAKDPETGRFVNATMRPEFLESLQFVMRLNEAGVMKPRPENTNWDWFKSEFSSGNVAMRIDESWVWGELSSMKDDWGVVLFPKGPRVDNYRVFTRDNVFVLPATYKQSEVDRILWAMSLWYTPQTDDWKSSMYATFKDIRAVNETLALIRNTDLHINKNYTLIPGLNRGQIAHQIWYLEGDPAQLVESVEQEWNSKINNINKRLFGE